MARGKIYNENTLTLKEARLDLWSMLEKRMIPSLQVEGLLLNRENKEVKIIIDLFKAFSPHHGKATVEVRSSKMTTPDKELFKAAHAVDRAKIWLFNDILKNAWFLIGTIGESKTEIVILYIETTGQCSYSLKTMEESSGAIFQNPHEN